MSNKQYENQKYLTKLYSGTKSFLTQKAPLFVQNTFIIIDEFTTPFMSQLTTLADERVDQTLERLLPVTDRAKQVGQKQVVDRYNNVLQRGKQISQNVQQGLQGGVNLALQNRATVMVIDGAGVVSERLLDSIETRIEKLSQLISREQKNDQKDKAKGNYQIRMIDIAVQFTQLSNLLFTTIKSEISQRQEVNSVTVYLSQARKLVQAHLKASFEVLNRTIFIATIALLSQSKLILKDYLDTLSEQMNKKQLMNFVKQQVNAARGYLTPEQIKDIYQVVKEYQLYDKVKNIIETQSISYKNTLEQELKTNQSVEQEQSTDQSSSQQQQEPTTKKEQEPATKKEQEPATIKTPFSQIQQFWEEKSPQKEQKSQQKNQQQVETQSKTPKQSDQNEKQINGQEESSEQKQDQIQQEPKEQDQSPKKGEQQLSDEQEESPKRQQEQSSNNQQQSPRKSQTSQQNIKDESPKAQEQSSEGQDPATDQDAQKDDQIDSNQNNTAEDEDHSNGKVESEKGQNENNQAKDTQQAQASKPKKSKKKNQ